MDDPFNTLAFSCVKSIASSPPNASKVHRKLCHHPEALTSEMTSVCCPVLITVSRLQYMHSVFPVTVHFSNTSLANIHNCIAHLFCCILLRTPTTLCEINCPCSLHLHSSAEHCGEIDITELRLSLPLPDPQCFRVSQVSTHFYFLS